MFFPIFAGFILNNNNNNFNNNDFNNNNEEEEEEFNNNNENDGFEDEVVVPVVVVTQPPARRFVPTQVVHDETTEQVMLFINQSYKFISLVWFFHQNFNFQMPYNPHSS